MDDFAEKFMCLSQYGTCRKKKCSSGKRETIRNDDDTKYDGLDSLFGNVADQDEKRYHGNHQGTRSEDTSPRIVANSRLLRQVYENMPKELLIDLLLLEGKQQNAGNDRT